MSSRSIAVPKEDKILYTIINSVLFLLLIVVAIPIMNVIANSLSSGDMVATGQVFLWPKQFSLEGYVTVFKDDDILTGYANTIFYTLIGTCFSLFLTILAAWPLSRVDLPGVKSFTMFFTFTMLFNGGMIPNYLLVKDLGIMHTRLAIILPMALNIYNMIITRTFFRTTIPSELREAAELDGCSEFRFFISMVLPLSKAILAVITLYYAVFQWNSFFNAFLYLSDKKLFPLTLILREILLANVIKPDQILDADTLLNNYNLVETLKYALIMVACIPVWAFYPFVQKYFVQGVMIGSVKG